jgi:hypothetical protein
MNLLQLREKSSQRLNLLQSLRDEKNRRFVSCLIKEAK